MSEAKKLSFEELVHKMATPAKLYMETSLITSMPSSNGSYYIPNYGIPVYPNATNIVVSASQSNQVKQETISAHEFVGGFLQVLQQMHTGDHQGSAETKANHNSTADINGIIQECDYMYETARNNCATVDQSALNGLTQLSDNMIPTVVMDAAARSQAQNMLVVNTYDNIVSSTQHSPRYYAKSLNDVPTVANEIDMPDNDDDMVDGVKLDKKRERNRQAARKCREKKLKKIAELELKVKDMKMENEKLNSEVKDLQTRVQLVKQQISQHMQSGCNIQLPKLHH